MKIGIKQFSNKFEQYKENLIKYRNTFDYIELYVYPDNPEVLEKWIELKNFGIKFTLHAPHFSQGVNLADKTFFDKNKKAYEIINKFAKALDVEYTVVHGGMDGNVEEIVRQLEIIKPYKMRIENKPFVAPRKPDSMVCRGATTEEIRYIMNHLNCEFNFDIGHAFCSAISQKINPYEYMEEFLNLKPASYHISDGEINNQIDIHRHIGDGDYNWNKILTKLDKNKNLTLETITKKENGEFDKILEDIKFLKNFYN